MVMSFYCTFKMSFEFAEIARVFNKRTFEDILQGDFTYLQKVQEKYFNKDIVTIGQLYDQAYDVLLKKYKNEYVFKNEITKKIVIGKHKLAEISIFNEFKVWNKYLDLLVVNGSITAYEIKTELDTYARLEDQLSVYQQVFEYVNLVLPENKFSHLLLEQLPSSVGVIVFTDKNTLSIKKAPSSNLENLCREMIFSCLRKSEYEDFVVQYFGDLPNVKPVYMRSACLGLVKESNKIELNNFFKLTLKKRKLNSVHKEKINALPNSLKNIGMDERSYFVEKMIKITNTQIY